MDIQKFNINGHKVRTLTDEQGEPWFVAKDVAEVLGYSNSRKATDDHCKSPKILKGHESLPFTSSPRGVTIIPERDVYRLIMRSRLPEAEKFEEWVVGEVLPSIRKHGGYLQDQEEMDPEELLEKALKFADSILKKKRNITEAQRDKLQ